jgi:hypothetical protein
MIRKLKDGSYRVLSEKGRNMGTYKTKGEAKERLKNIEMFKHMKSKADDGPRGFFRQNLDYGEREKVLKEKQKRLKRKAAVEELLKIAKDKKFPIPKEIHKAMKDNKLISIGRLNPIRRVVLAQGFITPEQVEFLKEATLKISRMAKVASMSGSENSFEITLRALGGNSFIEWIRGLK